jgi:cleavage stimulation factor subunit 3
LTFAYAEAQKIKKEFADVHSTYDKFLALLRSQLETLELTTTSTNTSTSSVNRPNNASGNGVTFNNNNNASASSFKNQAKPRNILNCRG